MYQSGKFRRRETNSNFDAFYSNEDDEKEILTEAQIVFKLALKGKHIKTIRFLINNDSANILLNSEDIKLLSE